MRRAPRGRSPRAATARPARARCAARGSAAAAPGRRRTRRTPRPTRCACARRAASSRTRSRGRSPSRPTPGRRRRRRAAGRCGRRCAPRARARRARRSWRRRGSRRGCSPRSRAGARDRCASRRRAHSTSARRSIQISAGCSGSQAWSTATRPSSCEPNAIASTRSERMSRVTSRSACGERRDPLARILLGPAGARVGEVVRDVGRAEQLAALVEQLRAGALRADVDADDQIAAQRLVLRARPAPVDGELERVRQVVLARDEHRAPVRRLVDLDDGQQQRAARDVEPLRDLAVGGVRRDVRDAVVDRQPARGQRLVHRAVGDRRSSSTSMSSARSQSALSTTRRPSAVRTRRRMLTGSPSAMPSATAISGGAGDRLALLVDDAGLEAHRRDHRRHAEVAPEVVVHRAVRDVGARAVAAADEAVLLEQRDRRAHRRARDAEHLRELGLGRQPVARAQLAVDDAVAQLVGELEAQRAAGGRRP